MKRMAIIGTAFMMAVGFQNVNAETGQEGANYKKISIDDAKERATKRVEELDKEVPLDLNKKQKNKLISTMVQYNNAKIDLQNEFQTRKVDIEEAFEKSISDILDTDQRESMEEYLYKVQQEYNEKQQERVRKAQEEWKKKLQESQ